MPERTVPDGITIYYARVKDKNKYHLLLFCIAGGMLLPSCSNEAEEWSAGSNGQTSEAPSDERQLVLHKVSVALDGVSTRVAYQPVDEGLQLAWEADETLGVYIQKSDNTIVYAGTVTSSGAAGDRGERRFTGTVIEKQNDEQYLYLHPALMGETQGRPAEGKISFESQSGALGSTTHLNNYIPLVWNEGSSLVSNHGYAVHLMLTFNEDPGTISKVALQTMDGVGETRIFPTSFDASVMTASQGMQNEAALTITSGTAAKSGERWTADAYIACSHRDINVFRTKFDVRVEAANGTYYNEFRSFPGQQDATSITGLPMLANGRCYNLSTAMSKSVAPTVISSAYQVNSLLGMWNQYGLPTDPFHLSTPSVSSSFPAQLTTHILDHKADVKNRILSAVSSQGTPTFTWNLLVKQIAGSSDGVKQADVTYNNLLIKEETEVFVTFLSEYAWNQNLLGYYHYPTSDAVPANAEDVLKTIIFPNVSKSGHVPFNKDGVDGGANINPNGAAKNIGNMADAPLQEFTTVQLLYNNPDGTYSTKFPAGTTIGFMMMRDTQASSGGSATDNTDGTDTPDDHSGYSPRQDNTLINWNAWRLFTNTKWNGNNAGFYGNCRNFFVSGKVVGTDGSEVKGLAIYGAKDDPDHNYNYSFSSMLFMVSSSKAEAMEVQVSGALNLGNGDLVTQPKSINES